MDILANNKTNNPVDSVPDYPLINKGVFRAYDIRGQIGEEWCLNNNFQDAFLIGKAIGSQLVNRNSPKIIVGRDARESSENISDQLVKGLLSVGCQVTDIGLTATPVVYFALSDLNISNAVMITGSHNPPDHNGIKIVYDLSPLTGLVIETLYFDIVRNSFQENDSGQYIRYENTIENYQQTIIKNVQLSKSLRVGIDASNGATALFAESLFNRLGCEVHPLFCELDGTFPNHSPDPTVPANLTSLINLVKKNKLDIGIAFDGDGDRMIAVDNQGNLLWPDRIMILLAQDILNSTPNARIVFDVKCSFLLPKAIRQAGGQSSMCVSGHSILKMQMKRLDAIMGGEFSGHIVLRDRWSDFDDGPYVASRLLEVLSKSNQSCNEIFNKIPDSYSTPEYKMHVKSHEYSQYLVEQFIKLANFSGADLSLIDGLRVDYEDGWGLVRSSNTSACLGFRFEATSIKRLEEIKEQFRHVLSLTDNKQTVPF